MNYMIRLMLELGDFVLHSACLLFVILYINLPCLLA